MLAALERLEPLEPRSLISSELQSSWRPPSSLSSKVEAIPTNCNKTLLIPMIILKIKQIALVAEEGKPVM